MSDHTISDHFYTKKGTDIAEGNTAFQNSTLSFRKLATPYVNETKNNVSFQNQESTPYNKSTQPISIPSTINDKTDLKALNDLTYGARYQKKDPSFFNDNLFRGSTPRPSSDDVQYSKYLSGTGPILSNDFLPNALPQKAKNPIIAFEEPLDINGRNNYDDWEDLNDEEEDTFFDNQNNPTGEWTSPVVKEALSRQVSKEIQFKTLWKNVVWLFGAHFFFLLSERIIQLHQINNHGLNDKLKESILLQFISADVAQHVEPILKKIHIYGRRLLWLLVAIIIVNVVKFAWPQDQCKDLPLTLRQRELIGLKPLTEGIEDSTDDSNLILSKRLFESKSPQNLQVPKYPRVNKLSEYIRKKDNGVSEEDFNIALQEVSPYRKLFRS